MNLKTADGLQKQKKREKMWFEAERSVLVKRFLILSIVLSAVLLGTGMSWAFPMVNDEVKMSTSGGGWPESPYFINDLTQNKTYASFCLESGISFNTSTTYVVDSVGPAATSGGPGSGGADPVDPLSAKLAAAYFSNVFNGIYNAGNMVQHAIWFNEDEVTASGQTYFNTLTALANFQAFNFAGSYKAVNLVYYQAGSMVESQSQLVVPEPTMAIMLGGLLLGVGILGRRQFLKR